MTKRRSQFPWRANDAAIYDGLFRFVADSCWQNQKGAGGRHTPTAHAHCIARAKMICDTVNAAREKR